MVRRSSIVLVALAFAFSSLTGCSDSTSPDSEEIVQLSLKSTEFATGGQSYFKIVARIDNASSRKIFYPIGCPHAVAFSVVNEQGENVQIENPLVDLFCLPGFESVPEGSSTEDELDLQFIWSIDGSPQELPPGRYSVSASFGYFLVPEETRFELKQSLKFEVE
jgi:hypothetical protein